MPSLLPIAIMAAVEALIMFFAGFMNVMIAPVILEPPAFPTTGNAHEQK